MKKALVVLMALAMVFSAFADAPAAKCEVTGFSGNASVTWTVDFDDATKTGFSNANSASFEFTLAAKGDKTAAGDGAVWGEIKIEGGESKNGFGTASVSTAKLHVGPAAINIKGTDVSAAGVATADNGITVEYGVDKVADFKLAFGSDVATITTKGEAVTTYYLDTKEGTIKSKTEEPVTTTKDITSDNYGFGVAADIKAVDGLTAKAAFNMKLYGGNPWNVEGTLGYAIAGADVSAKITKKSVEDFVTIAPSVAYYWGDSKVKIDGNEAKPGISVTTTIVTKDNSAIPLTVNIQDSTFVPNLSVRLNVGFTNLAKFDENKTTVRFYTDYNIADASTKITADSDITIADEVALKLGIGADYTGIANTTVSVKYASGDLTAAKAGVGTLTTTVKIAL